MKVDVVMPQLGESVAEGTVVKWLKKPGDPIAKDESILEITTDKVDSEIPSPTAGTLAEILTKEGETVPVGTAIARIETEAGAAATAGPAAAPRRGPEPEAARPSPRDTSVHDGSDRPGTRVIEYRRPAQAAPARPATKRFYSPLVRSIARKEGIPAGDLESISGSGDRGRVTKADILAWMESRRPGAAPVAAPAPAFPRPAAAVEVIPMDHMRKAIAEHMIRSIQTSAHVTSISEADVSRIVKFRGRNREAFERQEGIPLTYTPFFIRAVAAALREYPLLNASVEADRILVKRDIHVGVAVAIDDGRGLIVPVVRNADERDFLGLARAVVDLAQRARRKQLKPDDVQGGTFTITNPGIYGGLIGTPIINQPQVAILGTGAIVKRPVVIHDAIAIRSMMYLSLSYDHRIVDGAMGTRYLQRVVELLQGFDPKEIGWHAR